MYTTRFPHEAKSLQLRRQMVFEIVHAGRIHRQVAQRRSVAFSGKGRETNGWFLMSVTHGHGGGVESYEGRTWLQ